VENNLDCFLDDERGFTFPATAVADGIINLHNHIFYTSILITIFITYIVFWIILDFLIDTKVEVILLNDMFDNMHELKDFINANLYNRFFLLRNFKHDMELEVAWTIIPCVILLFIALPSFSFLYTIERVPFVSLFFKAIGHQWYWSYEIGPYQTYFLFSKNVTEKALLLNNLLVKFKILFTDSDAFYYLAYLYKNWFDVSKYFLNPRKTKIMTSLEQKFPYFKKPKQSSVMLHSSLIETMKNDQNLYTSIYSFEFGNIISGEKFLWNASTLMSHVLNKKSIIKKALIFYFCDSYMINKEDLSIYEPSYFTVDNPLVLPYNVFVGLMTSSVDVIHSFAVPEFGVKLDAIPGRVNQFSFLINRSGIFYGQCSELCGVGHAFMPITVYSINKNIFFEVMQNLVEKNLFSASYLTDSIVNSQERVEDFFTAFEEEEYNLYLEYKTFVSETSFFGIYISPKAPNFQL